MSKPLVTIGCFGVLVLAAVFVTTAIADDGDPQPEPPKDLAKAVLDLQLRVDHLENKLNAASDARKKQNESIEKLQKESAALDVRLDKLNRNNFAQMQRDIDDIEEEVQDLKTRVRRLE